MNFNEYQTAARSTAIYPQKIVYPALGLAGESGEVCEKIKKTLRDNAGVFDEDRKAQIKKEMGDVLWYIANLAADLDLDLEDVAKSNIEKLLQRQKNGTLQGNGDNR